MRCNKFVEFRGLVTRTRALGFDAVYIGHYAVIVDGVTGPELHHGASNLKNQSCVLAVMRPEKLCCVVLPLGDVPNGAWVRSGARRLGLGASSKPNSCGICFIPNGDTQGFLRAHLDAAESEIIAPDGEMLGRHEDYWNYTVG